MQYIITFFLIIHSNILTGFSAGLVATLTITFALKIYDEKNTFKKIDILRLNHTVSYRSFQNKISDMSIRNFILKARKELFRTRK